MMVIVATAVTGVVGFGLKIFLEQVVLVRWMGRDKADVEAAVRVIVNDVALRGDAAVRDYTLKFDQLDLAEAGARVPAEEIAAAARSCSRDALDAAFYALPEEGGDATGNEWDEILR